MRKIILLVLALVFVCTGVCAAEGIDVSAMTDEELADLSAKIEAEQTRRHNERSTTSATEDDGEIIYVHDGGPIPKIIFSSEEQLRGRLHKVELTAENWNEYLGDYYFAYEQVSTNNFGEITQSYEQRSVGFYFRDGYIGTTQDAAMKFTGVSKYEMHGEWDEEKKHHRFVADEWTEVNEEYTFDLYHSAPKGNIHLEKYECTAATGYLYLLEIDPAASRWIVERGDNVPFVDLYVGDTYYADSDQLAHLYEKLNP